MSAYTAVDLSSLPPPNLLAPLDFEAQVTQLRAEFLAKFPENHPMVQALKLESEPVNKVLEVLAYRLVLKDEQINNKARALHIAFAIGSDLDHIGVTYYRLARKTIIAADDTVTPAIAAVYETDDDYRYRLTLSIEAQTSAGSAGSYEFHALSASNEVVNVTVNSPAPSEVDIYLAGIVTGDILAQENTDVGVSADAVNQVKSALIADDIRPLTDLVRVHSATAHPYNIAATVYVKQGISQGVILEQGLTALRNYLTENYKPNKRIATSRIIGALDVKGVSRIELTQPTEDVVVPVGAVAQCASYNIVATSEVA